MTYSRKAVGGNEIRRGAVFSYVLVLVNAASVLILTPWLIRALGVEGYGLYTLGLSLVGLFAIDLGLGQATARFFSAAIADRDEQRGAELTTVVFGLYLLLSLILLIVVIGLYRNLGSIYSSLSPSELATFRVVFVTISAYAVASLPLLPVRAILTANERFAALRIVEIVQKCLFVILVAVALVMGGNVTEVILVYIVSNLIGVAANVLMARRYLRFGRVSFAGSRGITRDLVHFSIWLSIAALAQRGLLGLAPTLLGIQRGTEAVALLGVAITIEGYIYMIAAALNGLFLPRVTGLLRAHNGTERLQELMLKVGRLQLAVIGLVGVGFASLGREFITLWAGSEFAPAYWAALFLIAPSIVYLPQQVGLTAIVASGQVRTQGMVYAVMGGIGIAVSLALTPWLGFLGPAVGIFAAYSFRNVGINFILSRRLGLDLRSFYIGCYRSFIIPLGLMGFGGVALSLAIPHGGAGVFGVKLLVLAALGGGLLWILALNQNERALARSLIGRVRS